MTSQSAAGPSTLSVRSVGVLALVQDQGRTGLAHLGLGHSGAADRASHDLANRLVGNRPKAACIEATFGGLAFELDQPTLVAVTGAPVHVWCGTRARAVNTSFCAPARTVVQLGQPVVGLRSYVAVRGGVTGNDVLGSVSWDTMAKLGTPPLEAGDTLSIGDSAGAPPATDFAPVAAVRAGRLDLPLILGPRDDWFDGRALEVLASSDFAVSAETDRVGARLEGPELLRRCKGELASEGVVLGALQVPTSGRPTLFLADHPVTGGYPVIGCVPQPYVDQASQAVPGQLIRFHPRSQG